MGLVTLGLVVAVVGALLAVVGEAWRRATDDADE